jgi:DNA-directed RNA polymerase subunit K/omega
MEDDYDEDFVEEDNYYEDDIYDDVENELEEEGEIEEGEEDDISEIYQPKIDKKIDPIIKLSTKPRNVIIVPPNERITDNRLHKNEVSFILSTRAKEIAKHATHFLENNNFNNAISIAYHELYTHRCPLKLRRQVGITNKGDIIVEEWDTKTMILPNIPPL